MVLPPSPPSLSSSPSSPPTFSELLLLESVSDLITITFISTILLISVISLIFIFHFHLKSKDSIALQHFNSLYAVRILLVSFISLWALTEFLRLPFTRFYFFSPHQQSDLCKLHIVLSLGFFEPGFLVTLLFLLSFSIKKKDPEDTFGSAIGLVIALCLPVLVLQVYFIFFPSTSFFKEILWESSVEVDGAGVDGERLILCTYPLFGTIVFGIFGVVYILYFILACCKIITLVINKGLRIRIYALGLSVLVAVPTQVALLVVSTLSTPVQPVYNVIRLVMFLVVLLCAAVGEGILVIRPIADALAVGQQDTRWPPATRCTGEQLAVVVVRDRELGNGQR